MNKYPLIGGSICAVVLIVLASLTNVVGYQTVQASNQKTITTEVNEKELLFKTIIDLADNQEIQKVILGSELMSKRFFDSGMKFSTFMFPAITEKFLKRAYTMGVIFTKIFSKEKIYSILQRYQVSNQEVQKEITAVIENDAILKNEMTQLSSLSCDCENDNSSRWNFPIICNILSPLVWVAWFIVTMSQISPSPYAAILGIIGLILLDIFTPIGKILNCSWY